MLPAWPMPVTGPISPSMWISISEPLAFTQMDRSSSLYSLPLTNSTSTSSLRRQGFSAVAFGSSPSGAGAFFPMPLMPPGSDRSAAGLQPPAGSR
eukprot:CAMPEP_0168495760 /NCGR_PEP_ID=MMETSP0228-20121227/71911_1 /TAXON_ID=133427 /ORGANISM="Protoceratium reticulatum, Strain CCCM 535 (=CCMP 1889)" /LENGTH=94 /DNA_ID=CAMNT_0008512605 /DNA_START=206 /DNA_END=486 /DNA_ORIENTATION=+